MVRDDLVCLVEVAMGSARKCGEVREGSVAMRRAWSTSSMEVGKPDDMMMIARRGVSVGMMTRPLPRLSHITLLASSVLFSFSFLFFLFLLMRGVDQPNSPVSRSFRLHAGGIQPSASFFRPLRPTTPPDDVPLASFERERDHSNEDEESPSPFQQTFSLRRTVKPSREPLLPLPATASSPRQPKASFDSSSQQQHTTRRNTAATTTTTTFEPHPPEKNPPLASVPLLHPSGKPIRKYESHPSHNRFFLGGRILTGGDTPYAFLITVLLALFLSSLWFGTTGVWWWRNEGGGGKVLVAFAIYLSGVTLSCLGRAAGMDPGILPRGLDEKPPVGGEGSVPMPRDLRVRGDVVRVKYCQTCKIYRPPRASHCKMVCPLPLLCVLDLT